MDEWNERRNGKRVGRANDLRKSFIKEPAFERLAAAVAASVNAAGRLGYAVRWRGSGAVPYVAL